MDGRGAHLSICVDHRASAFLYDSFTNSLLPFYGPSNLIELAQQLPPGGSE